MAVILEKETDLEKDVSALRQQIKEKGRDALLIFLAGLLSFFLSLLFVQPLLLLLAFVLGCISFFLAVSTIPQHNEITILQAGIQGESRTRDYIQTLPDTYTAIPNVVVSYEGKRSEIDMLVVGPTGVFVIETKNLNGDICGSANDRHWTQHKIGRAGTPYSKEFYNPVKQVGTHVYRVANHLKANRIRTYVSAMVFFSNPDATVTVTDADAKIPVFSQQDDQAEQMLQHILRGTQQLSAAECAQIVNLLL